jgi:ankyrin repeat protein
MQLTMPRLATITLLICGLLSALGCSRPRTPAQISELNRQLLQAVDHHDVASARRFLDQGANLETTGPNDMTPLAIAASDNDLATVTELVKRGANIHAKDQSLVTPLMHAARGGHTEIIRLLLKENPDLSEKNEALLEAAHGGPAVVILQDTQNDHAAGPSVSREQIMSQLASPWVETVRLLLDNGADIDATDEYRGPPLIDAAAYAQADVVLLLLERGASIETRDKSGNTALIAGACECARATMNSAYDAVKVLLDKGSDVNAHSNNGSTALMNAAAGFGDPGILKLLLDHGADPRVRDSQGNTALKFAMNAHREDKVLLLKQALGKTDKR